MDPVTTGIFIAASVGASLYASKNQAKIEAASIKMQTEQARLQASEAALGRTQAFRNNLSNQLALSGMGFGSNTALATASAQSFGNYMQDINAINTGAKFAMASGEAASASSKTNRFLRDVNTGINAVTMADDLGLFKPQKKAKK